VRILFLCQYFPPEMGAPSARVHELSREWVRQGHSVTVLTGFAHHPMGIKAPGDRWRITRREQVDGIDVIRSYVYAAPNQGTGKRMLSYASFAAAATLIGALRAERPDVVIGTSPQLLCACAAYALSLLKGVPFVFEVRDLWPESIIAVEAMGENAIFRGLKSLADHLYRKSTRIVAVGNGYKRQIASRYGIDPDHMSVIPNGIDRDLFRPLPRDNEMRREFGWGEWKVMLYLGTHGMAHALHVVLDAAAELREDPSMHFVFVGEGAMKAELKRRAAEMELTNVQFIDQQPKQRIPAIYAACDVGLVTLRKTDLFQDVLPSKIFEYLAMERPLLISVDGDARALVERAEAGYFVPPEDVPALVAAIRRITASPETMKAMGRSGRAHVIRHYDRKVLATEYAELLGSLVQQAGGRACQVAPKR
jgi:colanic acid biosynthesis glycosyl transferase WcaI